MHLFRKITNNFLKIYYWTATPSKTTLVLSSNIIMTTRLYSGLITNIGDILKQGRRQAVTSVNTILLKTYWQIGKEIVEYEQKGKEKAEYGSVLLNNLSKDLRLRYGRGFSMSNIYLMRQLYFKYTIFQTVSGKFKKNQNSQAVSDQLTWTHYTEL